MGWDDSFRNASGYFLFLAMLALIKFLADKVKAARAPKPCVHGQFGKCPACQAAIEERQAEALRMTRRAHFECEWEKLRRSEVKRLSQKRLRSSEAYFAMEPREFEDAVMIVFRKLGYKVNQTAFVGDGGKDAIAWKNGKKYVIECKRYGMNSASGRRDLQILLAAKHDVEADSAIFVTTGRLTTPALEYAKENCIQYYDKGSFPDLINSAYGETEDLSEVQTICLECGMPTVIQLADDENSVGLCFNVTDEDRQRTPVGLRPIPHFVHTTINSSQLRYPDLDLDAPWCKDHQIPMHRVKGYRGEFWGCPEYPQCKNKGGSATRPPEVVESEAIARRTEITNVYSTIKESTRERLRNKIEAELIRHGIQKMFTPEQITALVVDRYLRGRT